jgi:hypothetical protein
VGDSIMVETNLFEHREVKPHFINPVASDLLTGLGVDDGRMMGPGYITIAPDITARPCSGSLARTRFNLLVVRQTSMQVLVSVAGLQRSGATNYGRYTA